MRKIYTIFLWLLASHIAISQSSSGFATQVNNIFQHVNRSLVTTGLLEDYGFQLTDITEYDGIIRSDNSLGVAEWRSLYSSLTSQAFNANFNLPALTSINTTMKNQQNTDGNKVNIMVMHVNYNKFKDNALTSNLMSLSNGKLYDVPGRPTTPYETKTAFAISPTTHNLSGASHQFILRQNFFVTNTGKSLTSRQVEFGDGQGYQTVSWNSTINVTYSTDGEKTIKVKFTYTDATVVESHSKIEVRDTDNSLQMAAFDPSCGQTTSGSTTITSTRSFSGVTASANIRVRYGQGHCNEIHNPLIVVEGFDLDNFYNILNTLAAPEGNPQSFSAIVDNNGPTTLLDALQQGMGADTYDIIYVDYNQPTTYVQANAYMLQAVIAWVNTQKAAAGSTSKNVVLGVSMGGLVARYALADMEDGNVQHDTRLMITHDTPHQGANIPPSF
jgi:hypothetical protein